MFLMVAVLIWIAFQAENVVSRNDLGRGHCALVTYCSCGGDINFNSMSEMELLEFLERDYYNFRDSLTFEEDHTAEYRIFTNLKGHVKTIGYITADKVVFEGRTYYFPKEKE